MNIITLPLIRAGAVAVALAVLTASSHAASSKDKATREMEQNGWIRIVTLQSDVKVGSPAKAVSEVAGHPGRVLQDGTWFIYKDFYVTNSTAHGTLVVSFKDGRVTDMRLVTPNVAVSLVAHPGSSLQKEVVASNR